MKFKVKVHQISLIFGILVIITFCVFFLIALALFPNSLNPIDNWMSDAGNSSYNPKGAIFFNLGCILTGMLLFPFYIGLYKLRSNNDWQRILLKIIPIVGWFSAFALIMVGVFSEDVWTVHIFWTNAYFLLNLGVMIGFTAILFLNPKRIKLICYYGIAIIIIDSIFLFLIVTPPPSEPAIIIIKILHFFEWFYVFTSLAYVGLFLYHIDKTNE